MGLLKWIEHEGILINGEAVKVKPTHYGSGLQNRLGTVMRTTTGRKGTPLIEVDMDSHYQAGNGMVAFKPEDLLVRPSRHVRPRLVR